MFGLIYAICFVLAIILMIFLIIRNVKQEVKNEFDLYDKLKAKYPDIKADNFDPLLYLVLHKNVDYLKSDNVVFFKSITDVTHCINFNGDVNNAFTISPYMNIIHIIKNKKSVKFMYLPLVSTQQKIEIIEE